MVEVNPGHRVSLGEGESGVGVGVPFSPLNMHFKGPKLFTSGARTLGYLKYVASKPLLLSDMAYDERQSKKLKIVYCTVYNIIFLPKLHVCLGTNISAKYLSLSWSLSLIPFTWPGQFEA